MRAFHCKAKITNSKYTVSIPPFEINASGWKTAAARATGAAIRIYQAPRGLRDRAVEIEVTLRVPGTARFVE